MLHVIARCLVVSVMVALGSPSLAAEYFVAPHGDDANSGQSLDQPLKTIQKGVDALSPGDTLTILPGEYFESVARENLGSPDVVTTIRAQIPGTVLLHGDVEAPPFKPWEGQTTHAGLPRIYVTDFDQEVQGVNEIDTPWTLTPSPDLRELSFMESGYYHDVAAGKLYITTSDLQPASTHRITISVLSEHGLYLNMPKRVVVEGLVARGFNRNKATGQYPGSGGVWGIILGRANNCVIRHCTAYSNGGGIAFNSAAGSSGIEVGGNLIEHCSGYGNGSRYAGTAGNILIFAGINDEMRHCYAHSARQHGLRIYGAGIRGPVAIRDSFSWGNRGVDIFIKGGSADKDGFSQRNITLSNFQVKNLSHSLMGSNNVYNPDPSTDNIRFQEEAWKIRYEQFADPDNFDYRLQSTSKFRGSGPDGVDRGPFPYQPNIYYVTPEGKDTADGLSTQHAWRTLDHAMKHIKAGDTLYLSPGRYQASSQTLDLTGQADSPTALRARGHGQVIINGQLTIQAGSQLDIQRLTFADELTITGGSDVLVKNCTFASAGTSLVAKGVQGLRLTHNTFAGFKSAAVDATGSSDLFITANLFANGDAPALAIGSMESIQFVDYNAYAAINQAWQVAGERTQAGDAHNIEQSPQINFEDGLPVVVNAQAFVSRGIDGRNVGFHREYPDRKFHRTDPVVYSVTDTTANIEWGSSVGGVATIAWGDTPECVNEDKITSNAAASYSLKGLAPGKTYYFRIKEIVPDDRAEEQIFGSMTYDDKPISFTTRTQPHQPRTLHVAVNGDDANDGLSPSSAFATLSHAGDVALPGDTVLVAGGNYNDFLLVRNTGEAGKPITFKAAPGEYVNLQGQGMLRFGILVQGKSHINIDGFYTRAYRGAGHIFIHYASHVNVSRCFVDVRGRVIASQAIGVYNCQNVNVSNTVMISSFRGTRINDSSEVTFEHCVFLRNYICCVVARSPQGPIRLYHNIFMDGTTQKEKIWMLEMGGQTHHKQKENLYFMRLPDEIKKPIWYYGGQPQISLVEYKRIYGDDGLIDGKPSFRIEKEHAGQEKVDSKGQPLTYSGDWIVGVRELDFDDLFSTDPVLLEKGVGLQPDAFADFHFNQDKSTETTAVKK